MLPETANFKYFVDTRGTQAAVSIPFYETGVPVQVVSVKACILAYITVANEILKAKAITTIRRSFRIIFFFSELNLNFFFNIQK